MNTKTGCQPFDRAVAFNIGKQCPIGKEIELLLGLDGFWPNIHSMPEAKEAILDGLAARFIEEATRDLKKRPRQNKADF